MERNINQALFGTKNVEPKRAFAIWAPIFLGELLFVTLQFYIPASSSLSSSLSGWSNVLTRASVPFVASQIFQTLWCASFRPKYAEGKLMYISTAMLIGTAYSLLRVHGVFAGGTKHTHTKHTRKTHKTHT